MKRWIPLCTLVGALLFNLPVTAQGGVEIILNGETTSVSAGTTLTDLITRLDRDPDNVDVTLNGNEVDESEFDNTTARAGDRISIVEDDTYSRITYAVGVGVVNADQDLLNDETETYFTANLRVAFADPDKNKGGDRGLRGYAEPEIAVWESDLVSDTLIGVNLIGVYPYNKSEFFMGAGIGVHQIESAALQSGDLLLAEVDESTLGFNAHFGMDFHMSQSASFFGGLRFDVLDDERNTVEHKIYVGVRFSP